MVRIRLFVCFLTIALLFGVTVQTSSAGGAVEIEAESASADRVVLQYRFDGYDTERVTINGATHLELEIPGEPVVLEAGAPALPHVNRSVIIPDDREMTVRVIDARYHELSARIAPSKGNLLRTVDPDSVPYEFGPAYRIDAFYPGALAELHPPHILREHRGIVVQANPLQYNPVTRNLRVYTELTLEVVTVGPGKANVLRRTAEIDRSSGAFERIYQRHFLNYTEPNGSRSFDEDGSMLIICHDAWIGNMAPFVAHKASVGIDATVVGVSTIGNTATAIKNYIQTLYDTSDLAFVLLVGDIAQVTSFYTSASGEDGASDPTFSQLAGSDAYPDILVGRFSASNSGHVDTQVQRTIDYETLPATEQDWFWRGTGIASDEGAGIGDEGQSDIVHLDEIRGWLLAAGYTAVDRVYDPGATSSEVAVALNAGRGVVNYTGHGWPAGWSSSGFDSSDVNGLSNTGKLPFIVSVACNNGQFEDYDSCFGETWLRATHGGEPSGAIGVYASTVSQSWAPPMEGQDEFNLLLADPAEPIQTFGGLCFSGSVSMMDSYGSGGVEMFETWIVFGDPSLRVVGLPVPPTGMFVAPAAGLTGVGAVGGAVTPELIEYTIENKDETPMDYAVTSTVPWLAVTNGSGTIAAGESVPVTVRFNECAANMNSGDYAGSVNFTNLSRHEGDTAREFSLAVGLETLRDDFDLDTDPGWSAEGQWAYGVPAGSGGWWFGNSDPDAGATGDHVFGAALSGDVTHSISGPFYLTMGPVDFGDTDKVLLRFQRWLNTQFNPPVSATVEVSSDGTTWHELWSNPGDVNITDSAWSSQEYDATTVAAGQTEVYFRWGYAVVATGGKPHAGWNIDDVELWTASGGIKTELTVEREQLSWSAADGATVYDVVQGDLGALRASGGDFTLATDGCLHDDLDALSLSISGDPPAGQSYWFLIRGASATGSGTYMSLSGSWESPRDTEIDAAAGSCQSPG